MTNKPYPAIPTDKASLEEVVSNNMGLVYSIARMFIGRGCEFDDLVQIGAMGLVKAAQRFDQGFGVCFSTYAVPMISGEIRRFLRDDGIIKISRTVKENAVKGRLAIEKIKKQTGKEPTFKEISEECGLSSEDLMYAFEATSGVESMDQLIGDSSLSKQYGITYEEETINKISIQMALNSLDARERQVIVMRYMMDKTQSYIASLLNISQVQVSRIEKKSIEKMRHYLQ